MSTAVAAATATHCSTTKPVQVRNAESSWCCHPEALLELVSCTGVKQWPLSPTGRVYTTSATLAHPCRKGTWEILFLAFQFLCACTRMCRKPDVWEGQEHRGVTCLKCFRGNFRLSSSSSTEQEAVWHWG